MWTNVRKNIKNSARVTLNIIMPQQHEASFGKQFQNDQTKGSGLNCNGCRIRAKWTETTLMLGPKGSRTLTDKGAEVSKRKNQWASDKPTKKKIYTQRGVSKFTKGYQPTNNLAEDKNGNALADYHDTSSRCKRGTMTFMRMACWGRDTRIARHWKHSEIHNRIHFV